MTTSVSDPDDVSFRRAERADLLAVARIERASFPQPWPFQAFERFLEEPGFLIAQRGSAIIGYVVADTVEQYGSTVGHVKDIAVHPDDRGRGVGKRLLERALSALSAQGVRRVRLEVRETNDRAISLYEEFGFEPRHRVAGYYDDGEDALVYVAELDA